jgi:hypothetical protein
MDIRRFIFPLAASLVVGVVVYALSLVSQQSLRADIAQLKAQSVEVDKRLSDIAVLAEKVNALETRLATPKKPAVEAPAAAAPAEPEAAPAAPAAPAQ